MDGNLYKNIQLMQVFSKAELLSYLFPDSVIYSIAIFVDDTTVYSKFDQTSDLWQQLLASELKSDLSDTVDLG